MLLFQPLAIMLLVGAAGWLLANNARGTSYAPLATTLVVFPMPYLFVRASLAVPWSLLVSSLVSLVIAIVVLFATRRRTQPQAPAPAQYSPPSGTWM